MMRGMDSVVGMAFLSHHPFGHSVVQGGCALSEQRLIVCRVEQAMSTGGNDEIVRAAALGAWQVMLEQAEGIADAAFERSAGVSGAEASAD